VTIFVGLAFAVALIAALGGRLGNVTEVEIRGKAAIIGAFVLQLVVVTIAPRAFSHGVAAGIHLVSYGLAIVFLYANRHLPNLWIAAVGGASNFVAIAANGGTMPASRTALAAAGIAIKHDGFDNSTAVAHARLAFLGDVFSIPRSLPLANVFSVGDVLLLVGAAAMLAGICGCPRVPALDRLLGPAARSERDNDYGAENEVASSMRVRTPKPVPPRTR
jgi:hypothetical protein